MQELCDAHSKCYANCRASQGYCDDKLRHALQDMCDQINEGHDDGEPSNVPTKRQSVATGECRIDRLFYEYHDKMARSVFGAANKRHCKCVKGLAMQTVLRLLQVLGAESGGGLLVSSHTASAMGTGTSYHAAER